jgi:hypothetical protein
LEIPEDISSAPATHQTQNPTWPGVKEHDQDRLLNDMMLDFDSDFVFLNNEVPAQYGYHQANNSQGQNSGKPAGQSSNPETAQEGPSQNSVHQSTIPQNNSLDISVCIEPEDEIEAKESGSGTITPPKAGSGRNQGADAAIPKSEDPAPKKQKARGPFQKAEDREETSLTRKNHACVRCRIQKVRVSLECDGWR